MLQNFVNQCCTYSVDLYDNDNEIHLFKPNFIYTMDSEYCPKSTKYSKNNINAILHNCNGN